MFTASKALSAAQAAHYYKSEWKQGDYYTSTDDTARVRGHWFGAAAAELGFTGDVDPQAFATLLEGRRSDGTHITAAEHGTGVRRAGWDFTCSADKSVSVVALALGDERLVDAHNAAVERAVSEMERHVQTRVRRGKSDAAREVQTTGRLAAALFQHESSRNLDPQLHTHCVVFNLTRRDDGQWRALQERSLFGVQRLLTAVYRADMAHRLRELGYGVEVRKDGTVGIAGVTREHIEAFSSRRAEVLAQVRELGEERTDRTSGASARQQAALSSRKAKEKGVDRDALHAAWERAAHERKLDVDGLRALAAARRGGADNVGEASREAVSDALEHLAERDAVFRIADVERVALERGMGRVTLDDVRADVASRTDLLRAGADVTTQRAIDDEHELLRVVREGHGHGPVIAGANLPAGLSQEQERAARHVLETADLVLSIEGKAGAGKSFTLAAVHDAAELQGWIVRGFAPTTSAAEVLRESGLQAGTVARLLREKDDAGDGRPQLWIVDEAGLLSTRQAAGLLARARAVGAKVVLVGDRLQHRAVEAGRPFAQLVDGGLRTVRLEEIRRQRDAALRAAVREASEGRAARAVAMLDRQGRVFEVKGDRERRQAVVERYMTLHESGKVLVVTGDNHERHELNRLIRQARIDAGRVQKASFKAEVLVARDLTPSQRRDARSYELGDHLTFHGGSRVYGIEASARGRVTAVDIEKNAVRVKLETGEVVTYNPRRLAGADVARVESRRFAVGDRIEFRAPDQQQKIVNGALAHVTHLDLANGQAVAKLDNGRRVALDLGRAQALDLGYATTSYRSQGRTVDHVIDVELARQASREKLYVSISRGREGADVFTDDREALLRRVEREEPKPAQALDLVRAEAEARQRQVELIAAAARDLAEARKHRDRARDQGRTSEYDVADLACYESEQRARPEIDQVRHHDLVARRAQLEQRAGAAAPATARKLRQELAGVLERLYELRHGDRTELGSFTGRLTLRDEARLHDAHRQLNERAEQLAAPELRSPLTREALAGRSAAEMAKIVREAQDLAWREVKDVSWLPAGGAQRMVARGLKELSELAAGRTRDDDRDPGWTIER